jgi:exosortase
MTSVSTPQSALSPSGASGFTPLATRVRPQAWAPLVVGAIAFAVLFGQPFALLLRDWWTRPEAGHGLLLAPVALWLAWRSGFRPDAVGNSAAGLAVLAFAVVVRYASGLAAELFTMRGSMILAVVGLVTYWWGFRQVLHWWLPFILLGLSIPLPEIVTQALALPLQFKASQMGAALLEMRQIPVRLTGNVIRLPGQELFVTEACSGLRSLTAIISMAVLLGALMLRTVVGRVVLVGVAILVAVLVNGVRVFLTGFLVFYVSPALGAGFMHTTEGWLLFLVSLACLAAFTWLAIRAEGLFRRLRHSNA